MRVVKGSLSHSLKRAIIYLTHHLDVSSMILPLTSKRWCVGSPVHYVKVGC